MWAAYPDRIMPGSGWAAGTWAKCCIERQETQRIHDPVPNAGMCLLFSGPSKVWSHARLAHLTVESGLDKVVEYMLCFEQKRFYNSGKVSPNSWDS